MYLFVWNSKLETELPCTGSLPAGDTGQEQPGHKLVLTWDASIINSGSVHHTMLTPHLWAWEHLTFPRQMFFGVWRPVPMLAYVKDSLKVHIIIGSLLLPLTFSYSDSVGCDKETVEWRKCHQAIPEEREVVSLSPRLRGPVASWLELASVVIYQWVAFSPPSCDTPQEMWMVSVEGGEWLHHHEQPYLPCLKACLVYLFERQIHTHTQVHT